MFHLAKARNWTKSTVPTAILDGDGLTISHTKYSHTARLKTVTATDLSRELTNFRVLRGFNHKTQGPAPSFADILKTGQEESRSIYMGDMAVQEN